MNRVRCAVYTRKSTEDGLEHEFNSLDAQREACEAFILSQKHEGWSLVPAHYDDGGFSGGNIDRPGLQELLKDVEAGLIDVIVVYKVDPLTRSLAGFAKIVEQLDAKDASFVSVTQAFNTTTSMGRLTLNVLLSFAQFERDANAVQKLVLASPELPLHRLAKRDGRCRKQMTKLLRLSWLSPRLVESILDGKQPRRLTRKCLLETDLPTCWRRQEQMLGFRHSR